VRRRAVCPDRHSTQACVCSTFSADTAGADRVPARPGPTGVRSDRSQIGYSCAGHEFASAARRNRCLPVGVLKR
jgi:hypothetical protein